MVYSPDGTKIASASIDNTVKIWNAQTGQCVSTLTGHNDPVLSVCFSPCGTKIVSGGGLETMDRGNGDCSIRIWDSETGTQIGSPLTGHRYTLFLCFGTNNYRTGVLFSSDS